MIAWYEVEVRTVHDAVSVLRNARTCVGDSAVSLGRALERNQRTIRDWERGYTTPLKLTQFEKNWLIDYVKRAQAIAIKRRDACRSLDE